VPGGSEVVVVVLVATVVEVDEQAHSAGPPPATNTPHTEPAAHMPLVVHADPGGPQRTSGATHWHRSIVVEPRTATA
jgi:hypothetical protein